MLSPQPLPPPSLPTTLKYGEGTIFSEKSFSWGETFLDKFMQGIFKSCSLVCRLGHEELVWPLDRPAEWVCLGRLQVGGNYLWCLLIVKFMWLGGTKRLGGRGGSKVVIWGKASYKGEGIILCGVDPSRHHSFE